LRSIYVTCNIIKENVYLFVSPSRPIDMFGFECWIDVLRQQDLRRKSMRHDYGTTVRSAEISII